MSLTESQAQHAMLVRALEQARDNGGLWSAGDAQEATRETAELAGAGARMPFGDFVARRAERVLDRIGKRPGSPSFDFAKRRWPALAGWAIVALALVFGFLTDHLVSERRVNLVEYPLVGLILWNVFFVVAVLVRGAASLMLRRKESAGPLAEALGRLRLLGTVAGAAGGAPPWVDRFRQEWISLAASLNRARIELVLHAAALCFALGALAGLYVRGIFREYRAGWESTFLSPDSIHAIVSVVLAPGAYLLDLPIADVQHIAGLRLPDSPGEIARDWIHLYAASIVVWIVVPRLLCALASGFSRWALQRSFPLPMDDAYFTALRAVFRGGSVGVVAVPFRYELTPQISKHLSRLLQRIYGLAVNITIRPPALMGESPRDWQAALDGGEHVAVLVIFNLAATAEPEPHAQLMKRILGDVGGRFPVVPIVDTASYADRDVERFRQRCNQWRNVLDSVRCQPLFLDLSRADDEEALASLQARLNRDD